MPATRTESHIATHYYSSKKQHIVYFAESISRLVFQMSKTIYSFFQLSLQNKFVFGFVFLFVVGKPKKDTFSKAMNATIFFWTQKTSHGLSWWFMVNPACLSKFAISFLFSSMFWAKNITVWCQRKESFVLTTYNTYPRDSMTNPGNSLLEFPALLYSLVSSTSLRPRSFGQFHQLRPRSFDWGT